MECILQRLVCLKRVEDCTRGVNETMWTAFTKALEIGFLGALALLKPIPKKLA
jgi:hypothetical protein